MTIRYGVVDACVNVDGVDVFIRKGERFDDSEPQARALVERWPDYFEVPNVEQATAGPGERRNVKRPSRG